MVGVFYSHIFCSGVSTYSLFSDMAYDPYTIERIERILQEKSVNYSRKNMFGGVAFMVDDKMCFGLASENLMCRVGPDQEADALASIGTRPMDFTGRPMKGYVFVSPEGYDTENQLETWIDRCLAFNPLAKASKKKQK